MSILIPCGLQSCIAYYVTCFDAALDYLLYFKFDFEIEEGNVEASTHSVTSAVTAMVSNPLYKACDMRYADDECVPILSKWHVYLLKTAYCMPIHTIWALRYTILIRVLAALAL